jgi:xanthine dehydrogenase accessory factor
VRGPETLLGLKALIPADGEPVGPLLEVPWRAKLLRDAYRLMGEHASGTSRYENDEIELFFDVHRPPSRLIIVGAVHIADALIRFARPLGYRTYLVDPRTAFATEERFPHVDEMRHQWPDEALPEIGLNSETAVVVITHDPKLDDPALKLALPSPAFYVGALGSPKTHARRVERLLTEGLSQEQLDRLHAPIGLDLGGRTPAEIALSIMAEIVAAHNQVPLDQRVPQESR